MQRLMTRRWAGFFARWADDRPFVGDAGLAGVWHA
jgi:hypothetical protein